MAKKIKGLTKAQLARYMTDEGSGCCPFCQSANIEGDGVCVENLGATQEVSCNECMAIWTDVYKMTGVEVLTRPDK